MNLPKTGPAGARLRTTVHPTSASSGHPCDPNPLPDPWILLGIVIAEPLWHFSYGAELNALCDFKAFPGNLVFLCSHHFQRLRDQGGGSMAMGSVARASRRGHAPAGGGESSRAGSI